MSRFRKEGDFPEESFAGGFLRTDNHHLQMQVIETVELLQEAFPSLKTESLTRRFLAQYGEAYLFFNHTGELCFLTDFTKSPSQN